MVSSPAHDSKRGNAMKLVSTALLAAALGALGACGDSGEENVAANTAAEDLYNVAPDDLGGDNLLGNETLNDTGLDNEAGDNAATENAAGNGQ
jgi:hypothetical protein